MKTNLENTKYQSTFLPLLQRAETEIKKLTVSYALLLKSKRELLLKTDAIIEEVKKRLPKDLKNRTSYVNGLIALRDKAIRTFYTDVINKFLVMSSIISYNGYKVPKNPIELTKEINTGKIKVFNEKVPRDLYIEKKGVVRIPNYSKELTKKIEELANDFSQVDGKGISLWQKAEIDLRYEKQMDRLTEMRNNGVKYAWGSSHADCSERCSFYQSKLFNIDENAIGDNKTGRMSEKYEGHIVYSLVSVMNLRNTEKWNSYGWANNFYSGFNCRHHLIPYESGKLPPKDYTKKDIAKERKINSRLREMERQIRNLKQNAVLNKENNPQLSKKFELLAKKLFARYENYAHSNGFATEIYRTKI